MAVQQSTLSGGKLLEAVSNLVVGIYADQVGRGPTKARSYVNGDIVVCLMEDTMTRAEKTLVESGHSDAVTEVRAALHETMRDEMMLGIERLTGRQVVALNSGANLEPDVMSDLFLLGPPCDSTPQGGDSAFAGNGHARSPSMGRRR